MPQNPPEGYTRINPYLYYEDSAAAIDFITRAFGFTERFRFDGPDGKIAHAELDFQGEVVMLGSPPESRSPKSLGAKTGSLYVYVDDVDAHCAHAKEAGATIVREPEDQFYGDRMYGAEDPEGHEWYFGQRVRDVSEEEMTAAMTGGAAAS
jgi:PhnB protein